MKNIVIKYGLISGMIVSAFMLYGMTTVSMESADLTMATILGIAGMLAAFSLIYFAIRNYRDKQNDGLVTFGKGFQIGIYISIIASTLYVVSWMAYYQIADGSEFTEVYLKQGIEQIQQLDLTDSEKEAQIEQMTKEMAQYDQNGVYRFFLTYVEILPWGIIVSLICAGILRRKELPDSK